MGCGGLLAIKWLMNVSLEIMRPNRRKHYETLENPSIQVFRHIFQRENYYFDVFLAFVFSMKKEPL